MYLPNDLLTLRNLIRSVVLVPLDPVPPHFDDLLSVELPSNTKASNCIYIGVKVLLGLEGFILRVEDRNDIFSVSLYLRQLTVSDKERIDC
jgi:hypothetical protein